MLNPYVAIILVPQFWIYIVFLPLILGLYIKGLNERKGLKYIFLMCVVWALTCTSGYADPKLAILDWAPLLLFFFFHIFVSRDKKETVRSLRFTGALFALWTAINAYWILPVVSSIRETIASPLAMYSAIGTTRLAGYELNSAPLSGALRLLGFWGLHAGDNGFPYFSWASAYDSYVFIAIGFLIPILAFGSLLHKPRNKYVLFFSVVALTSLFLIDGAYSPFGWINVYLVTHITFAIDVFSSPYMIGGAYLVLGYAFLIGYTVSLLYYKMSKVKLHLSSNTSRTLRVIPVFFVIFLIIGVYAFPIWNGDVIYPGNAILASDRYSIPSYYYDASSWLGAQHEEFNIFPLPYSILGYAAYTWEPEGFNGPDPTESILHTSVVSSTSGGGIGLDVAPFLVNNSTAEMAKTLALMNVKYVLFHGDANWGFLSNNKWYISASPEQIQAILNNQTGLSFEKAFGELDFYLNDYWQPMQIYVASTSILSDGNLEQLMQIAERNDFASSDSVILLSNHLDAQQISTLPMNIVLVQNPNLNSTYMPFSGVQTDERLVYVINSQPVAATAKYYSGWKDVIRTNGEGDPGTIVFSSPSACPYLSAFPNNSTSWNAYSSTLIYIKTASLPLSINSITADGASATTDAWWQTGTSWITGWPITIPSNQNAVIQVNKQASNITLQTNNGPVTLSVTDGLKNPLTTADFAEQPTTIVTPNASDYLLAINVESGYGYGSFYVKVDNQSYSVDLNSPEQEPVLANKYIGPLHLTAGSHTLTASEGNISISQIKGMLLYSLKNGESFVNADDLLSPNRQSNSSITYQEINPTRYTVHVNSSNPFYLVFSESYDNGWIATVNGHQIPDQYHFIANGYANGWYVNQTGTYTITLEFSPQKLFYIGSAISIATLAICTIYLSKNKLKLIYKKFLKKTKITATSHPPR